MAKISLNQQPSTLDPPFQTPPAGSSMHGTLPIATKPTLSPKSLTPAEQKVLMAAGWQPGQPIPADLSNNPSAQALMQEIQAEKTRVVAPAGVPADFKVRIPEPVEVPDDRLAEVRALLTEAAQAEQEHKRRAAASGVSSQAAPGVADAVMAGMSASETVDDRASPTYATGQPKLPDPPAQPQQTHCPHCEWPLRQPDDIEITDGDRQQFLDCYLAGVQFIKTYSLLDGNLKVTVRQLTPTEEEGCYQQALRDFQQQEIQIMDVPDRTLKYRVCLQLLRYEPRGHEATELPDSLAEWSPGKRPDLREIRQVVSEKVLKNESILRTLSYIVSQFVRLTLKLEAQVFNADFLKRTV